MGMESIRATFFQECGEQLADLEAGLTRLDEGDTDPEAINGVFRSVHSIKGGAGAFGLETLVEFAHTFETVLDRMREGTLAATGAAVSRLLRAADILSDLVAAARDEAPATEAWREVAAELEALTKAQPDPETNQASGGNVTGFTPVQIALSDETPPTRRTYEIAIRPTARLYANANDPALMLDELRTLGDCTVIVHRDGLPNLDALDPAQTCLWWTVSLVTEAREDQIREIFEFVVGDCEVRIDAVEPSPTLLTPLVVPIEIEAASPPEAPGARPVSRAQEATSASARESSTGATSTIRVDLERVDRLIDLVGELVINQAMLTQRVFDAGIAGSSAIALGLEDLEHLSREIQDSVMAIRAQPVRSLFQRMARIVRECAQATGKQVRLRLDGEATEIDKTVIERLVDPLTHMIRNAIDHGIESVERREAAGKAPEGTIRLSAAHRSGRVVIEIADDGAGIDRQKVRSVAASKALIAADAQLTDAEIDNLLFLPGFTTASAVSSLSGRGVGMDVVKKSIQALGGRISIASSPGAGTTFSMSLPLTLAVLDGMVVSSGAQTLVVPVTVVVETLRPSTADTHLMGNGTRVIAIRGGFVPIVDVAHELGLIAEPIDPARGVAILVETERGARFALLAEAIQDQRQVVIKSLETNYGRVDGIAAATILGDGRVALIVDVDAIVADAVCDRAA